MFLTTIKNLFNFLKRLIKYWRDYGATVSFIHWEYKIEQLLWKSLIIFLKSQTQYLAYAPAILFLDICPKEMIIYFQINICTQIFTELIIIDQI